MRQGSRDLAGRGVAGWSGGGADRRSDLPERKPATPAARRYTPEGKAEILRDFEASDLGVIAFCRERGLNANTLAAWRKAYVAHGESGLLPKENLRNRGGRSGRVVPADERRALVEAFLQLKLPRAVFAKQYGIAVGTLANWLKAYAAAGPKGLEPKARGRKPGQGGKPRLPAAVRTQVLASKARFPSFGMRKLRDYVRRFFGLQVSAGGVAATLKRAGIAPLVVAKKRKRGTDRIRRFERAKPGELWQTDITSFVLTRHSTRVYLVVFLDDHARYVVAWGLSTRASGDWVCETLLDGVARFGKPLEVLSDQGPQYFAWRGKSKFQKLLVREGIRHVVARAHHPQTVGKCERLWATIGREFWERARPQDLGEARTRLSHYFNHYNHFRPHQGLAGQLPADRFFGAGDALRATLEGRDGARELELALDEAPRKRVYLMGQVGEHKVSLHAEQGRIEVHTEAGLLEEMGLEEAGVSAMRPLKPPMEDGHDDARGDAHVDGGAAATSDAQAALPKPAAAGDRGEGTVGGGESGGAAAGAGTLRHDPGAVAGEDVEGGAGEQAGAAAAAGVAAESAGAVGNDRGAVGPAADARTDGERSGRGGAGAAAAGPGCDGAAKGARAGEAGPAGEPAGERAPEAVSGDGCERGVAGPEEPTWQAPAPSPEGACRDGSASKSERCSGSADGRVESSG